MTGVLYRLARFSVRHRFAVLALWILMAAALVAARMASLGKANWYLPRWLGRILPRISIEGEEYFQARDQVPPVTQPRAPQASTARS